MTKAEREKIYALLSKFYPKARQLADKETLYAYGLVLANYNYEDVRSNALRHAERCKFFPDVSELVSGLRYEPAAEERSREDAYIRAAERAWATQPPWELCHILRDHGREGGTAGELFDKYVPQGCIDCRRKERCYDYERKKFQ
jgi:hypothetical protein